MKWEVGKTYTWKDALAKTAFITLGGGYASPLNSDISKAIGDKPFIISMIDDGGWIDVIELDGVSHTAETATGKKVWEGSYFFSPSDIKFFREVGEVETVKEPDEKVTTDSKVIGQLKRLFSSRYGLTMVKFGEANEGKTFERFDDFVAALDKMDEIMQDRQKIKDLQEDIKRREVEFLIGKERGW